MRRAAFCGCPPPRRSGPRHCISQDLNASGHADRIPKALESVGFRQPPEMARLMRAFGPEWLRS
jgi:hypothetical protein